MSCFDGDDLSGYAEDGSGRHKGRGAKISVSMSEGVISGKGRTYADTPMFSSVLAVVTIAAASVKPNLYVHGATGWVPVAVMALKRVVTCVCSVNPMDLRFVRSAVDRPSAVKSESENWAKPCW